MPKFASVVSLEFETPEEVADYQSRIAIVFTLFTAARRRVRDWCAKITGAGSTSKFGRFRRTISENSSPKSLRH